MSTQNKTVLAFPSYVYKKEEDKNGDTKQRECMLKEKLLFSDTILSTYNKNSI